MARSKHDSSHRLKTGSETVAAAEACNARTCIVAPAKVSDAAKEKARGKLSTAYVSAGAQPAPCSVAGDDHQDFWSSWRVRAVPFEVLAPGTTAQREAFKLLGVRLERSQ